MDTLQLERCSADAAGRCEHAGRRGGCIMPPPSPSHFCSRRAKEGMIVKTELKNRRRRGSRAKGSKRRHREARLARIGAAFVVNAHQQEKEGSSLELQQKQKQAHLDQGAAKSGDLESQQSEAQEVSRSGVGKATSRVQVGAHQDRCAAQSETKTSCDVQDRHTVAVVCVFVSWFGGTCSAIASTRMVAASTRRREQASSRE